MSSERRRLLGGTGWTLSSTIVALTVGAVMNPVLALQALQMPFAMGSATLLGIFQGRRLFRPLALLTMIQSALGLVLTIGLLANGQGLIGVMIASASGAIAFFGILLALNWKSVVPTRAGDFVEDFRKLVPFGIRLTATNAL